MTCPKLPIPEPLRGIEWGTFTHESIAVRLPQIGRRMLAENNFPPAVTAELEALLEGIPGDQIRPLAAAGAPDAADWVEYVKPHLGQNWLEVPWFFAEAYFYRRILDLTGYFQPGPGQGADPFLYQKRQGLETTRDGIRNLSSQVSDLLARMGGVPEALANLLAVDLWGNQADLSLWPAGGDDKPDHQDCGQQRAHTLVDDSLAIAEYFLRQRLNPRQVAIILDNASFELVADLYLAVFLLAQDLAETVWLHAKCHPTFVSDALIEDIRQTLSFLKDDGQSETAALGQWLQDYLGGGRLRLRQDWFWTSPLEMWQMPEILRKELGQSTLIISKGDANYRRLVGDRHWPFTTPFAEVVCYMPASLAALRTLKSEVAVGLSPGQPAVIAKQDPAWLVDGRWGLIQFADLSNEPALGD